MSVDTTSGAPSVPDSSRSDFVYSYLTLRLTIGFVALVLPVLLVAIAMIEDRLVLPSISDSFYHHFAVSVFVGSMCAFAAFLWAYQFSWWESRLGNVGAVAGAAVALFPTSASDGTDYPGSWVAVVHYVAASAFFLVLGVFCVLWFRTSSRDRTNHESSGHPLVYIVSGAGILLIAVAALVDKKLLVEHLDDIAVDRIFLVCEILMIELFGLSWVHRGGGSAALASAAAAVASAASLILVFLVPPTGWVGPAVIAVLAVAGVFGLLWNTRPKAPGNRYEAYVRSTGL
jgi:hypothetical protein